MEYQPREELQEHENTQDTRIQQKEVLFREFVESKLFYSFSGELKVFGYTESQLEDFYRFFDLLKHDEKMILLAFPWELKQRAFPAFKKKIDIGELKTEEVFTKILEASRSQSRRIAYHCSGYEIEPTDEKDAQGKEVKTWAIKGTENDHRDNDLPMAYYSFDYYNLYRTKNPRFIYIVSIQTHLRSGHRKDSNKVWGRAPSLTIIEKIDIKEADEFVTEETKEHPEEIKRAA